MGSRRREEPASLGIVRRDGLDGSRGPSAAVSGKRVPSAVDPVRARGAPDSPRKPDFVRTHRAHSSS